VVCSNDDDDDDNNNNNKSMESNKNYPQVRQWLERFLIRFGSTNYTIYKMQ